MSDAPKIRTLPRSINREKLFRHVGYTPHAGQQLVHDSRAHRRVMACGVRFGKTTCAAMEGVAAALEPVERSVGWIVAPTYELSERVMREVVHVFQTKFPHRIRVNSESRHKLLITNMEGGTCEIRGKSADAPVSLLGEGLDWLIVDEAAQMQPATWQKYLSQRLIDKHGWAMLISTPRGKGWFYDMWRAGQERTRREGHESWNLPSWANPMLNRAWIEAQRDGIPDAVFRQEYGAEFVEGVGAVFRGVRDAAMLEFAEPVAGENYTAGLDLAKVQDWTVLVIMNSNREVVYVDRFQRIDWAAQVARVRAALLRYNDAFVLVDSTGVGDPIYELLQGEGCRVDGYPLSNPSKTALINNLVMLLEQGKLGLPRADVCPELVDEMEAFEYSITPSGNVTSAAPPGMHDDCVIALALAAWEKPGDFEIYFV